MLAVSKVGNWAVLTVDETDTYLVIKLVEQMVFSKVVWKAREKDDRQVAVDWVVSRECVAAVLTESD